jgi:hypothetical protein
MTGEVIASQSLLRDTPADLPAYTKYLPQPPQAEKSARQYTTYADYEPRLVQSVKTKTITKGDGVQRQSFVFSLGKEGTLTILLPLQSIVFPLPSAALTELNGALGYFKENSNGAYIKGNKEHTEAAAALEKYWIDIGRCFYEEGTIFPETLESLAGVVYANLGVNPTESDVLGFGPDNRIFNLELKKQRRSYGTQIRRQEAGIGAVLFKENGILPEPDRVVSAVGAYAKNKKRDRMTIDFIPSQQATIYQHYTNTN